MEAKDWIDAMQNPPTQFGYYMCKNDKEEFPAFYTRNARQEKIWFAPFDKLVTHYKATNLSQKKNQIKTDESTNAD